MGQTIQRFAELGAWQKSRSFAAAVWADSRTGEFARDSRFSKPTQRAAVSVVSDDGEGFERDKLVVSQFALADASGLCDRNNLTCEQRLITAKLGRS